MREGQSFGHSGELAPAASGHLLDTLRTRLREQKRELVAADAGGQVGRPGRAGDGAPHLAPQVVSLHWLPEPADVGDSLDVQENTLNSPP